MRIAFDQHMPGWARHMGNVGFEQRCVACRPQQVRSMIMKFKATSLVGLMLATGLITATAAQAAVVFNWSDSVNGEAGTFTGTLAYGNYYLVTTTTLNEGYAGKRLLTFTR